MDLYIECPVCEQHFSTPHGPPEQKVDCPSCARNFKLASAVEVPPPIDLGHLRQNYKPRLKVPAAFESRLMDANGVDVPPAKSVPDPSHVTNKPVLKLQRKRRNRRRLITTLVSSAFLATIIGVLAGLLVRQLKQNAVSSNGLSGTVLADSDPDTAAVENPVFVPSVDDQTTDEEPDHPAVVNEKPIPRENIPSQKFDYLDRKAAKSRWNAVQPHLVSLKVFDGLGTHEAVGTIVDSRGWILTSYQAVKGASKIEVKASVNSIDDYWEAEPLTDLVRGYIAEQKENDLVLLSINRRFVVAFSTVQPATKNNIVEAEYLLQCAPPSRTNLYGGTETRISNRAELESLDPTAQSMARRMQLDGKDLVWIVATGETPPAPGTPLFKIDGELAAISVFTATNKNYFLPVDQVKGMIAHTDDDVKPLRELGISTGNIGPVAVSTSSEMYEPSVRLNQLAESCKVFDWIPRTAQDYHVLQEFAEAYSIIEKYARQKAGRTVVEEKKIVDQKVQLENLIRQRAMTFSPEDERQLAQMNKNFANPGLQGPNLHVPFYGEVHSVDIVNARLILNLVGTESYVMAPFVPSDDPLRMQTKWLFFGQTPKETRPVNYRISDSEIVTAEPVIELLTFGDQ